MIDSDRVIRYADLVPAKGTEPRLRIMQLALCAHQLGLVPGIIQSAFGIPPSTLSHHLDKLKNGKVRRESTFLWYTASTEALKELLGFLYAECCTRNKAIHPEKIASHGGPVAEAVTVVDSELTGVSLRVHPAPCSIPKMRLRFAAGAAGRRYFRAGVTGVDRTLTGADFLDRERELHRRAEHSGHEFLWIWELEHRAVVVGRSGNIAEEINIEACSEDGIPWLRRDSGGGAVLLGRGCLNYTLILDLERRPELRDVENSFRLIVDSVAQAIGIAGVKREGSDLTIMQKKFGGSSQRRLKRTVLHHGTILYAFELADVGRYLQEPGRRPAYRQRRTHAEFLRNVPLDRDFGARLQTKFPETQPVS
jgi:ArsR family transcriptional regulator